MKLVAAAALMLAASIPACAAPSAEDAQDFAETEAAQTGRHDAGAADAATVDAAASTFVDVRDGHAYRTMRAGGLTWLAENLAYAPATGSFCYDDDPASCAAYGRLYTWSAAKTACPAGFRLASDDDWKSLETAMGMHEDQLDREGYATPRGTNEGAKLKDPKGFAAKMAGYRGDGAYDAKEDRTYFWVATTRGNEVWRRRIAAATPQIFRFTNPPADFAISVRCVSNG